MENTKLILTIEHSKPIELTALAKSMISFASEFDSQSRHFPAKLYVKEIRSGSIIQELIPILLSAPALLEAPNTLIEFAQNFRAFFDWCGGKIAKSPKSTIETLNNYEGVLGPIVADNGGAISIDVVQGGTTINNIYINSEDAKNAVKVISRELALLESPEAEVAEKRMMQGRDIFKVRFADMVGEAQWKFVRGGKTINAVIGDVKWLDEYHGRQHVILPEDCLEADFMEEVQYDAGYNEISRKMTLTKIHEVKRPMQQKTLI